jgi:hypothetical protein
MVPARGADFLRCRSAGIRACAESVLCALAPTVSSTKAQQSLLGGRLGISDVRWAGTAALCGPLAPIE